MTLSMRRTGALGQTEIYEPRPNTHSGVTDAFTAFTTLLANLRETVEEVVVETPEGRRTERRRSRPSWIVVVLLMLGIVLVLLKWPP